MIATKMTFTNGSITIQEQTGQIFIYFDNGVVPLVQLIAKNCGIPGVIGPDIDINLREKIERIQNDALMDAASSDW